MKPSWEDAPEWANYLAMDEDGDWYWFKFEPIMAEWDGSEGWDIDGPSGFSAFASTGGSILNLNWFDSLEYRPEK